MSTKLGAIHSSCRERIELRINSPTCRSTDRLSRTGSRPLSTRIADESYGLSRDVLELDLPPLVQLSSIAETAEAIISCTWSRRTTASSSSISRDSSFCPQPDAERSLKSSSASLRLGVGQCMVINRKAARSRDRLTIGLLPPVFQWLSVFRRIKVIPDPRGPFHFGCGGLSTRATELPFRSCGGEPPSTRERSSCV